MSLELSFRTRTKSISEFRIIAPSLYTLTPIVQHTDIQSCLTISSLLTRQGLEGNLFLRGPGGSLQHDLGATQNHHSDTDSRTLRSYWQWPWEGQTKRCKNRLCFKKASSKYPNTPLFKIAYFHFPFNFFFIFIF